MVWGALVATSTIPTTAITNSKSNGINNEINTNFNIINDGHPAEVLK